MIVRGSLGEDLQRRVHDRGLACSDRPGHQDKTFAAHYRFDHRGQRSSMRLREMKESWIRGKAERLCAKMVERGVGWRGGGGAGRGRGRVGRLRRRFRPSSSPFAKGPK